jgi:HSP20 family protein
MAIEVRRPRSITTWRPFQDLDEIERRLDEGFGQWLTPKAWRRFPLAEKEWLPAFEMFEKEDKFVVKAELPGMKQEDVDISVTDSMLSVKGEKRSEREAKEEDYYFSERSYGSFLRSIDLPSNVDTEKIEASFDDGVLVIDLPKIPEAKPKKVTVKARKKEPEKASKASKEKEPDPRKA